MAEVVPLVRPANLAEREPPRYAKTPSPTIAVPSAPTAGLDISA